jgi:N-acetylglucosaminyldiphosphoundecaprenol N-acetyl-beta-D-mannosaminyltransferase
MRQKYFNINLDVLDKTEALDLVVDSLKGEKCSSLFFVNAHCFNVAQRDNDYRKILNESDFILNDGIGLKLGSYLANVKFKDNLNGTDFIPEVIRLADTYAKSIYLIGCIDGVARNAKSVLEKNFKNIKIVGSRHGYITENDNDEIINEINLLKPEILLVGMGVPKQEKWIWNIKDRLDTVKLCIAGGAIIDFIAGNVKRAPTWMRNNNIEWLYRLYVEPQRMWKRYLVGNVLFFYYVIKHRLLV